MHTASRFPRPAHGFSLSELMVAMALGLLILGGLTTLFVRNSRTQGEIEKAHRQVENGRYAIDVLTTDLRNAGFYGELNPIVLPDPGAQPAICAATLNELQQGIKLPVQGMDQPATAPSCLPDLKAGTDVLVVRRTRTCLVGAAGCDTVAAGGPFFQASLCNNSFELGSVNATDFYRLGLSTATLDRHKRDCTAAQNSGTLADLRRYLTHIYFIANNNEAGDGIPTLKRAELGGGGDALAWPVVPLAEGIENLQVDYGLDLMDGAVAGQDGVADQFHADPATANACAAPACEVTNWQAVVAVKLNLLARNPAPTQGHVDKKTYTLGPDASLGPFNDSFKRHVFQSLVALPNPAGRR